MKRIISFCVLGIIAVSAATAQAPSDTLRNSLTKGAKAIQFSVLSNFTLGSFNGATFSGKWQLSNRRALRFGIDVFGDFESSEINTVSENRNSDGQVTTSNDDEIIDDSDFFVTLNSYFIAYPNPDAPINFYTGIGPTLSWSTGTREEETVSSTSATPITSTTAVNTDDSRFFGGLGFLLGVEWFINSRISLTSEYGITASYQFSSTTTESVQSRSDDLIERNNEVDESDDRFRIDGNGVRFGLSVYF